MACGTIEAAVAVAASAENPESEHFDGIPDMDDQVINDIKDYASENPDRVADVVKTPATDVPGSMTASITSVRFA